MDRQLKAIIELQAVDDRIVALKGRLARIPDAVDRLSSGYQREQKALEEMKAALEAAGRDRRIAERELDVHEEKVKKLKDQQFMVKTNKEYQTILHEIQGLADKKNAFEDTVLSLMEKAAEIEKGIKAQEQLLSREKEVFNREEQRLGEEQRQLQAEMASDEGERAGILRGIDGGHLKSYTRLREFHKGKAVAPVVDGICQGCHLELRPQKYQEVKKNEAIMTCDQCNRIIYQQETIDESQPGSGA